MNSSSLVLNKIKDKYRAAVITKMALPVIYATAFKLMKETINELRPDAVVCMGQAGGRSKVCIERIAVNINNSTVADNNGEVKTDSLIIPFGAAAYFSSLPYKKMLAASGGNTVLSYSAGTYICNDIFYRLMNYIKTEDMRMSGGFLHLPFTEHFDKMPYMDLETQVCVVQSMLAVMGD